MYLVTLIKEDGSEAKSFTADLEDINRLLKMQTPFKSTFKIMRVV